MKILEDIRLAHVQGPGELAKQIEDLSGFRFSDDEYRACANGLTKRVPFWVIVYAAHVYSIPPETLMPYLVEYS